MRTTMIIRIIQEGALLRISGKNFAAANPIKKEAPLSNLISANDNLLALWLIFLNMGLIDFHKFCQKDLDPPKKG